MHLQRGVFAYRRKADADGPKTEEDLLMLFNFSDMEGSGMASVFYSRHWVEMIDSIEAGMIGVNPHRFPIMSDPKLS